MIPCTCFAWRRRAGWQAGAQARERKKKGYTSWFQGVTWGFIVVLFIIYAVIYLVHTYMYIYLYIVYLSICIYSYLTICHDIYIYIYPPTSPDRRVGLPLRFSYLSSHTSRILTISYSHITCFILAEELGLLSPPPDPSKFHFKLLMHTILTYYTILYYIIPYYTIL